MEWVQKKFSDQSGNLDLLAGTGVNAPTATQSEMLQANTSVRLSDMQSLVYQFTAEVGEALAYYLHTDPLIELPLARRVNGQDQQVVYTPEMRQGDWLDFHVSGRALQHGEARPEHGGPSQAGVRHERHPAAAQAVQLLGPGFKIGAFLKRIAQDVGIEDVDEFINDDELTAWLMMQMQMNTGDPGKAGGMMQQPMQAQPIAGMNAGQPNPAATGPTGGISANTERASAQQEGVKQPGRQPSANALAQNI
jgi:hypothetical protein